ncbi:hypothetical protein AWB83_07030 [Caballeronia ptereochthonis]|uniref:Uncharacterized protein n=1 Tax=Caballeronia ptereochthonis TaxID=1777144 RepID=A0A158EC74_9BURK|nr:hypothetical protein AWB83_07030 [Caballeronia ptereochthonis]
MTGAAPEQKRPTLYEPPTAVPRMRVAKLSDMNAPIVPSGTPYRKPKNNISQTMFSRV